jgi:inorganic pyrophosphatase/exopolyphosphatase
MKPLQKENSLGKFSSISSSPLPKFSTFLDKKIYEKLKVICNENEIDAETFITELLTTALNHHKNEVEQIIKNLKR